MNTPLATAGPLLFLLAVCLPLPGQNDSVPKLIEQLRSDNISLREAAAKRLRGIGRTALKALRTAAEDRDAELAARARRLVQVINLDASITPRIRKLRPDIADRILAGDDAASKEVFMKAVASIKLPNLTKEDLGPLAPGALRASKLWWSVGSAVTPRSWYAPFGERGGVCHFIVRLDLRSALPVLSEMLEGEPYTTPWLALETLGRLKATETAPRIVPLLGGPHTTMGSCRGCRAMEVLCGFGTRSLVPSIRPLLKDGRPGARIHAARALAGLVNPKPIPLFLPLLKDEDPRVRQWAASFLAGLNVREAIPAITSLLDDEKFYVRSEAVEALGILGATEAAREIMKRLKDSYKFVRAGAIRTLIKLDEKSAAPQIMKSLEDPEGEVRRAAIEAMASLGCREAVPLLVKRLKEEDYWNREAIVKALKSLGATAEIPRLVEIFKDTEECKEWSTCHWMRAGEVLLGEDSAVVARSAAGLLADSDRRVRDRAIWLLARLDPKGALPVMEGVFRTAESDLRVRIASVLCRLGSRKGVETLLDGTRRGVARLSPLNALRDPQSWKQLDRKWPLIHMGIFDIKTGEETVIPHRESKFSGRTACEFVDALPDVRVEQPRFTPDEGQPFVNNVYEVRNHQGWTSLGDLLDETLNSYEFICEKDRIRILHRNQALKFWRGWWKAEQAKEKGDRR